MKSSLTVAIVGSLLTMLPAPAFAVSEIAGATFPEQIVQEGTSIEKLAKQAESYATQIQQYANQLQQYENMVQNTVDMPQATFDQIWNPLVGTIQKLQGVYSQAQALGYAGQNIGATLAQEYQGAGASIQNLSQNYANWNATTNQTMKDTLESFHLADLATATEDQALTKIQHQAATAKGRANVAGAAVAASTVIVKSLQSLQQITENGQRAVLAYDKQKKAEENVDNATAGTALGSMGAGINPNVMP
nr:P-type conjugative transfer protein TrbJ [Acidithiobacillus montserratensis]